MAYNPGVSFFIRFYELDPSQQSQCIFFTQKGQRCKWQCQQSDNGQAIILRNEIMAMSSEAVTLRLLQDYILCNCCRSGRARHRDRIEDIGLLIPLAQRWQDEIRASTLGQMTTLYNSPASPLSYRPNDRTSFSANVTPSRSVASSSSYQYGSPRSSVTAESPVVQPHYNLRSREANISARSLSTQPPQSEFRPHIAEPLPTDSVSWKILEPLDGRDFETGSLYIFDRASSPGHVKIGWTAKSVSRRLDDWSRCGYQPNLLFSVHDVPYAQRAETLTHHQLIKEWRRERQCNVCGKSHQEWFEISKLRAVQVLGGWADFMKKAEPYDSSGELQGRWRKDIEIIKGDEEVITAKKLLEHYKASSVDEAALVDKVEELRHATKIEEEVGVGCLPKVEHLEATQDAAVLVGSARIEQSTLPKETSQLKSESMSKPIPLLQKSFPQANKQLESDRLFEEQPIPKTESLPRTQFMVRSGPPFKIKPWSEEEPLCKTEPLSTKKSAHEEISAQDRKLIKKELPTEQIPPPSSLFLQSTTSSQASISLQETKISRGTGIEEISATHINTNPDTKFSIIDNSYNPGINPSASTSASTSLSTITSPSATPCEDIPQTNNHISTDGSNTANSSLPLSSSDSSPKSNPSTSSTSISAFPRLKADQKSDTPALPFENEISEAPLSLSTDTELEAKVAEPRTPIIAPNKQQQNIVDGDAQAQPDSRIPRLDTEPCEEGTRSCDPDESTVAAAEEGAGSETGSDGWDADETLVEDQVLGSLEEAATLKMVNSLCDEISAGKLGGAHEGVKQVKLLGSEAASAVEAVAQA